MEDVKRNRLKEEEILNFLAKKTDMKWNLSIFDEIDSTNTFLLKHSKPDEYSICLAEGQSKGRGRYQKKWQSPKYKNIYMSLGFSTEKMIKDFSSFSLVSALAVSDSLKNQNVKTEIKWPNDIFCNSKKIGGILVETTSKNKKNIIVVGIGLNVFMTNNSNIDREWSSLFLEYKNKNFDRNKIISEILINLVQSKEIFEKKGFSFYLKKFNSLNFLKEKRIYLDNDKKIGIAKLINVDGSLNVEYEDEEKKINSGEVSIKIQN